MPLQDQWARQHAPLRPRERRTLRIAALAALVAGAIAIPLAAHGSPGGASGCVEVTVPSTTGAAAIHACGARARRLCTGGRVPAALREPCRRAGFD